MRFMFAVAAAALLAGSAQAATIVNGSFEAGLNAPGGGFNTLSAGNTDISGWTIGGAGIDWIGTYWQASNGTRSLDLSALAGGSVSQNVTTVVGGRYKVSFDMAGNPDGTPPLKTLNVTINGGAPTPYTFTTNGTTSAGAMGWVTYTYDFVAGTTVSTLAFTSIDNTPSGPALDNVSISGGNVPEPATWAMLIAGFGLVGVAARRRRGAVAA
nr:choice-of-anchor C family protein [Polymorphobacter sp.]